MSFFESKYIHFVSIVFPPSVNLPWTGKFTEWNDIDGGSTIVYQALDFSLDRIESVPFAQVVTK